MYLYILTVERNYCHFNETSWNISIGSLCIAMNTYKVVAQPIITTTFYLLSLNRFRCRRTVGFYNKHIDKLMN